ncbi:DUF58 domain-containing protein [Planctomicrobium sp. SH527]|uniref:DUF58 domain-containing protein n=1 Tax=Planctomicrobium sp. SH527 TaxID=3448123 RepID=UPI003F5C0318
MKRRQSWLMKKIAFFFQYRLTPVGQMAVLLMFLSACGIITVEIPIHQIFSGIVVLFGFIELTGSIFRPKLKVMAAFPERISAGETASGTITVQNLGYFPAFDLMCGAFQLPSGLHHVNANSMIPYLGRGKFASLPVHIRVDHRGHHVIPDIWMHSTFPLNFLRVGNTAVPIKRIVALPQYQPLEHLELPISYRFQSGGQLQEAHSGNTAEYKGNREYIPGEPSKRLDFRAWARVGKPVVREYQEEVCSHVSIVLDTHIPHIWGRVSAQAKKELEAAISLTAAIADSLDHQGSSVEIFAAGPELFHFETNSSSSTYLDSILEILAGLDPNPKNPFEELNSSIRDSLESTSIVICIFLDWDDARQELVNQIVRSGCSLKIFLIRETPTTTLISTDTPLTQLTSNQILQGEQCPL